MNIMIEAPYACFTRPELKIERVTYDVPTPSAIEGVLKSIYWKPAIRYVIDKIAVFNPINHINITKNEIKNKLSYRNIKDKFMGKNIDPCIYASSDKIRTQRKTQYLTNVKYGVKFHIELTGLEDNALEPKYKRIGKHYGIIRRRIDNGEYFRHPCMGLSECLTDKIWITDTIDVNEIDDTIKNNNDVDLGYMLYGLAYKDKGIPANSVWCKENFSDEADPVFYHPHMENGIIDLDKYRSTITC